MSFQQKYINKKINKLYNYRDHIAISNLDAKDFITNRITNFNSDSTFIFFDPPYYKQGKNLYLSFVDDNDHKNLSKKIIGLEEYK